MKILFLLKSLEIGGLEIVTANLANKFVLEGHDVVIWAFYKEEHSIRNRIDEKIPVIWGDRYIVNEKNVYSLRETLLNYKIEIVINQLGLPYKPARLLKKAKNGLDIKTIAVCHSNPAMNGKIMNIDIKKELTSNIVKKSLLSVTRLLFKFITSASMRYVYNNSDYYMVLADIYKQTFAEFIGVKDSAKLLSLPNPVTIDSSDYNPYTCIKEKKILYVGRLENVAKRVSRVIEIWKYLEKTFPDWKLIIVGDGPEKEHLENLVNQYNLKEVQFEGFKIPNEYYKKCSVLLLTSEFEGFPLVLSEASSYGTIPVAYGSFPAVYDIIANEKNGLIVLGNKGFDAAVMAEAVSMLMKDEQKRNEMSYAAYKYSKHFSMDAVYKRWLKLFETIL